MSMVHSQAATQRHHAGGSPISLTRSNGHMDLSGEVSLRPLSFRPGGKSNPFANLGKGAGAAFKGKVRIVGAGVTSDGRSRSEL